MDSVNYMYLFGSSRSYSFMTLSGTQAVASSDSTFPLHPDGKVNIGAGDAGERHGVG